MMIADILHGGAIKVPTWERPFLVGKKSKYYADIKMPTVDLFPISGTGSWLDIIGSIIAGIQQGLESTVGAAITAEVYHDANCPRRFPKLLSDESYSRIMVAGMYLIHQDIVAKGYENLKTFVEASAVPVRTMAEATKNVTESVTKMLSALPAETGELG